MTTAMQRDAEQDHRPIVVEAEPTADVVDEYWDSERIVDLTNGGGDLWAPSLYGPRTDDALDPAPPTTVPPTTVPPTTGPPIAAAAASSAPIDIDELARTAAEVALMVTRHREELAAAMAELTSLQRTLRSEVRAVISELDRIAAGVGPERAVEGDSAAARSTVATDSTATNSTATNSAVESSGRRSVISRLRRRS